MRPTVLVVSFALALAAQASAMPILIAGGGETLLAGGSGGDHPLPLKSTFALRFTKDGDQVSGWFECLALAPASPTSGLFTENVMYVTGRVASVSNLTKTSVSFSGSATITGFGSGVNVPFSCIVDNSNEVPSANRRSGGGATTGGPGAYMTLTVSGLTFDEIVTQGGISITPLKNATK